MKRVEISVINDLVTDQRLKRMVGTLRSMGMDVHVIGRKLAKSMDMGEVDFAYHRFDMIFRKGPLFYAFYNLRLFFYLVFRRKADLYIAIDLDTLCASYLVSRLKRRPLLYDSHEYFTEVPELLGRPRVRQFWEGIERMIVPKLEYAIAVSDSISAIYSKKYGVPFETIRNLSESVVYVAGDLAKKYTPPYTIIYQGALNKGRGLELVIQAMKWMQNARFLIFGDGDVSDDLKAFVREIGIEACVEFGGKVQPEELKKYTQGCHLGISLEEDLGLNYRMALPNKIFDYVQARVPVLCADLPEMAAVVREYKIGEVLESREPRALASQMSRMLNDKEMNEVWKKNLDIAARELVWEKEEAKLKGVVGRALEGKGFSSDA